MTNNHHKLIILGSGPAGWTAAVYAARANLNPIMITGMTPGGQLSLTTDVDNWPGGKEGLQGPELMESMKHHAERFNTQAFLMNYFSRSKTNPHSSREKTPIPVMHSLSQQAQLPNTWSAISFQGKGVSACATCDGFLSQSESRGHWRRQYGC